MLFSHSRKTNGLLFMLDTFVWVYALMTTLRAIS
jgi:hypothetical protein